MLNDPLLAKEWACACASARTCTCPLPLVRCLPRDQQPRRFEMRQDHELGTFIRAYDAAAPRWHRIAIITVSSCLVVVMLAMWAGALVGAVGAAWLRVWSALLIAALTLYIHCLEQWGWMELGNIGVAVHLYGFGCFLMCASAERMAANV